jgi:hypothetical protein
MSMKNSNDTIWNRNREIPAFRLLTTIKLGGFRVLHVAVIHPAKRTEMRKTRQIVLD